jgi:hypothetical protein
MATILEFVEKRLEILNEDLKTDHKIGADPYDTVGKIKEVEKIKKEMIKKGLY